MGKTVENGEPTAERITCEKTNSLPHKNGGELTPEKTVAFWKMMRLPFGEKDLCLGANC